MPFSDGLQFSSADYLSVCFSFLVILNSSTNFSIFEDEGRREKTESETIPMVQTVN